MPRKKITIYDVAEKSGISIATVSRVLNNPDKVKQQTKNKVYAVMKDLGFIPKAEARERAKQHLGRIGIISTCFTYPSSVHRLRGISNALVGTSFEMVIITVNETGDLENYLRSMELTNRLDGIIILSQKLNSSTINILKELSIETVFVEFGEDSFPSICIDNKKGGELVADYLLNKGYSSFSLLTEQEEKNSVHPNRMRSEGFQNQLGLNGIFIEKNQIQYASNNLEEAMISAELILSIRKPEHAVFATTDFLAIAVIKTAKKLEINIPTDLGVIGFDGTNISEYLDLSTVDQSLEESGKLAVEILLKRIKQTDTPIQTIFLPLRIIERDTTRK